MVMSVTKEARRDAKEFARAKMYYGEGAGIRRRLIEAAVQEKAHRDPQYASAFHIAMTRQDMAEHAHLARLERKHKDRSHAIRKNIRGVLTGNAKNMQTGVLVAVTVGYVLHDTGLDKVIYDKTREKATDIKLRWRAHRAMRRGEEVIHDITNLKG